MKFSILVPSRKRIHYLNKLFESIDTKFSNKQEIEILVGIDNDDIDTINNYPKLVEKFNSFSIKFHIRNRSPLINEDYYNWLGRMSKGDYIWALGDDCYFNIDNIDIIITKKIEDYLKDKKDRIALFGIKDNTPKPNNAPPFPCFPLVTKEAFKLLNMILHYNLPNWCADSALYDLYTKVNRYLPINDTDYITHVSTHTGLCEADETHLELTANFRRLKHKGIHTLTHTLVSIIPEQIKLINEYIERNK